MNAQRAPTPSPLSMAEANYINRTMLHLARLAEPPANDGTLSDTATLIALTTSMLHNRNGADGLDILRRNCLRIAGRHQQEANIIEATSLAIAAMEGQPDGYKTFINFIRANNLAPAPTVVSLT